MRTNYVVVLNRAHVRFYAEEQEPGQSRPALREIDAVDLPRGRARYTAREADEAGHFPAGQPGAAGGGIDERLPMQRQEERRSVEDMAAAVNRFFREHPEAPWDLAVPSVFCHAVMDLLEPQARRRLRRTVAKDLVKVPAPEIKAHFAAS